MIHIQRSKGINRILPWEIVCDEENDVLDFKDKMDKGIYKFVPPTSTIFVIESGNVYILNSKGEWKEL